jgi:small subunit ribosomal protein S8
MPVSKLKAEIARLLKENHYIHDFKVLDDGRHGVLRLYLKYYQDKPVIRELQAVSKPGLRQYVGVAGDPPRPQRAGDGDALHLAGVLTDREARAAKVGGEVLAIVW